ncbi:MAG: hypothetical protein HS103_13630 [Anaerolineales bacterium]|nr:hypothetical protein [Anaerolineales bacterium]
MTTAPARVRLMPGWMIALSPFLGIILPRRSSRRLMERRRATLDRLEREKVYALRRAEIYKEARLYEGIIVESLARMGFCWNPRQSRGNDEQARRRGRVVKVKIEKVRFDEYRIVYKLLVRRRGLMRSRDMLPYKTSAAEIVAEKTLEELGFALERVVKSNDNPTKGARLIVYRQEGAGVLPKLIKYEAIREYFPVDKLLDAPLIVGVGKNSVVLTSSLQKQPHWFIAGASNSGKSNEMNQIIASWAIHLTPADIQFIMIDPKIVELQFYERLPHLMRPIIHKVDEAIDALHDALSLIDRRTELLASDRVKNISEYNALHPDARLPRIVIVIEELARLLGIEAGKAAKKAQSLMVAIGNTGRAAGVHLIAVTQTPKKEVMPTELKANMARMVGKVDSIVASMIVLSTSHAALIDDVPGRMILAVDSNRQDFQAPLITNADVQHAVAIACGKHAGLIRLDGLIIVPLADGIIRHTITHCDGKLSARGNLFYFRDFALTETHLKDVYQTIVKTDTPIQVGRAIYSVKREGSGYRLVLHSTIEDIPPVPPATDPDPTDSGWRVVDMPVPAPAQATQDETTGRDLPGITERRATAIYKRDHDVADAIWALKTDPTGAEWLGRRLADEFRRAAWNVDLFIPIPLSEEKYRTRGYNQADLLAAVASRESGIPCASYALERMGVGIEQKRKRTKESRTAATATFWAIPDLVRGRRVCLVDDVITTGATMIAAAAALRDAGAVDVYALAVASGYVSEG